MAFRKLLNFSAQFTFCISDSFKIYFQWKNFIQVFLIILVKFKLRFCFAFSGSGHVCTLESTPSVTANDRCRCWRHNETKFPIMLTLQFVTHLYRFTINFWQKNEGWIIRSINYLDRNIGWILFLILNDLFFNINKSYFDTRKLFSDIINRIFQYKMNF